MGERTSTMEGLGMMRMDVSFYKGKRVFITGCTGFKGAWMCRILVNAGAIVTGYALEPSTQPNLFSMAGLEGKMTYITGDIRNLEFLSQVFGEARPEIVIHMAAQPIVRIGYEQPVNTYETNIMGTVNLLECIRTAQVPVRSAVNVTTDKVYQNKEWLWGYREDDSLDGYDPYSNSKSCSELVTHSYIRSFFSQKETAVSTLRAGNVFGGGDFAQDRIIPDCVRAAQSGRPLVLRNPNSMRPYQHVLEPVFVYLMVAQRQYEDKHFAGCYNVGPDECDCITTIQLVKLFQQYWGEGFSWMSEPEKNAPHEDTILKLDCAKLKGTFGWHPRWHVEEAVEKTVDWTRAWLDGGDIPAKMDRQIEEFIGKNCLRGIIC